MSSGGTCGLYGLRLMHRLNIFLSCFGPRAGQAFFFWPLHSANPNPSNGGRTRLQEDLGPYVELWTVDVHGRA
ncbi:hypothetical protein BKA93DRAFT_288411 [Sparassis latifolia]